MSRQNGASNPLMSLDKRSKIMLVVLVGVLLIAAVYFLVLKKSGSSNSNANGPVAVPSAAASAAPKSSTAPKASPTPTVTPQPSPASVVTADSTRDPFLPLAQEAAAVVSASPNPASSSSPSSPSSSSPAPTSSTSSSAATGDHTVTLLTITGSNAAVSYDSGSGKTVKQGSTIAPGVVVEKVNADSIYIVYSNKPYALVPGQTVTLQNS